MKEKSAKFLLEKFNVDKSPKKKFKTHDLLHMKIDYEDFKDLIKIDGVVAPHIRSSMTKMFEKDTIGDLIQ